MLTNIDLIPYRKVVCQDDSLENYQKSLKKIEWGETKMKKNDIITEKY